MSAMAAIMRSGGIFSPSGNPWAKATPALVVAMAGKPAASMMRALATSHTLGSKSTSPLTCIARNASAFFTCSGFGMTTNWMQSPGGVLHLYLFGDLFRKSGNAYDRSADRAAADLLCVVAGGDAKCVEASVERFEQGFGFDASADPAGGAVFDVDRCADGDLVAFAVGLQRVKCSRLHQSDHVGRGIYGWQLRMVRGESVLEGDSFFGLAAGPNGNGFCQKFLQKEMSHRFYRTSGSISLQGVRPCSTPFSALRFRPMHARASRQRSRRRRGRHRRFRGGRRFVFRAARARRSSDRYPLWRAARSSRKSCRRLHTWRAGRALSQSRCAVLATRTHRKRRALLPACARWPRGGSAAPVVESPAPGCATPGCASIPCLPRSRAIGRSAEPNRGLGVRRRLSHRTYSPAPRAATRLLPVAYRKPPGTKGRLRHGGNTAAHIRGARRE